MFTNLLRRKFYCAANTPKKPIRTSLPGRSKMIWTTPDVSLGRLYDLR